MRWAPGIVGLQLMWNQKGELRQEEMVYSFNKHLLRLESA